MKYLFLLGPALVNANPSLAQEVEDAIVVTATRIETPITHIGQPVTVITNGEIERTQTAQAAEVLARVPGITISPSGGFGHPTSVFIRGADNAQSLILIDGVRINDPGDVAGGFDFGGLTIGQFDRVEVVRGSSGVLWGSRAIGGVVNFITPRPAEQWTGRAQAEYGWRDRRQVGASAAGMLGPVGLTLGGNWMKGDGFSAFNERRGATEKDGFESRSANARAEIELVPGFSADAGGYYTKANYEYDDTGADALHLGEKRDSLGYANLRYTGFDGRVSARIGYGLTDTRRVSDHEIFGPYVTDGRTGRFEGQASFTPLEMISVLLGAETEEARFSDNFGSRASTSIDSYFGNLTLRPLGGLTLNGGLRYDDHADFGHRTTFAANGAWALAGEDAPILRASYGEGFKAPSLYQLYTNGVLSPLKPETSKAWDVGVEQPFAKGKGRFTLTWFDRKTRNLIDFDLVSFNYFNVGRTRSKGIELGMVVSDWEGFDLNLSYTYLDAKNVLTGTRLARRPQNNLYVSLDRSWAMGLRFGADLRVGGSRYDDHANTQFVDGHVVVGVRASYPVTENVGVYGRIENVFNEHYEIVRTYGTPTRSAYAGVRVKI